MEGGPQLVLVSGSRGGGGITYSIETTEEEGFPEGAWEGTIALSGREALTFPTDANLTADQLGGPFALTVTDGVVDGTYAISLAQRITAPDLVADGVGTLTGVIVGCSFDPQLVAQSMTFAGTVTDEDGTRPFNFTQDFPPVAGAAMIVEVAEEGLVSGRLPNEPYIQFMEGVGIGVNDFTISFEATPAP
jgi:hypothetical protein